MKYLFTLCLLIVSLSGISQWQQTGARVRYVNGLGIPTRDTAAGVAADSSQILIRPADSSLYIKYKRTWVKVGAGGTIGGSGTTNRVPKFTGATTLGNSSIVDSASAVAMTINPSGNVGIGTPDLGANGLSLSNLYNLSFSEGSGASYANIFRQRNTVATVIGHSLKRSSTANFASSFTGNVAKAAIAVGFDNGSISFFSDPASNVANGTDFTATERMRITTGGNALIGTTTDNGVDRLQVSGSAIATTLKVNTSGQTASISTYYNGGAGKNIWIGGGGLNSTSLADYNVSVGQDALLNNTSGFYQVAVGFECLKANTTGNYNVAIGVQTLGANTTGVRNVGIGANCLGVSTTGSNNMAFGFQTMIQSTTASDNVAIGSQSLNTLTTGNFNIAIGRESGRLISGGGNNSTSSESIYLGSDTRPSANGNTNEMVFGHNAIGQGSNSVTLGNSSITKTFLRGATMVNTTTDNGVDQLQVNGSIQGNGLRQAYLARTTAYTITNNDYFIDCTTGTFTVTLPASSGRTGRIFVIKNSGTGTITVDGNGAETIDGAATQTLSTQWSRIQIISDGTNWKIISN